ncbi:MAG TPA: hypothetical protein VF157_07355 [Chloroflexota bacterium]
MGFTAGPAGCAGAAVAEGDTGAGLAGAGLAGAALAGAALAEGDSAGEATSCTGLRLATAGACTSVRGAGAVATPQPESPTIASALSAKFLNRMFSVQYRP